MRPASKPPFNEKFWSGFQRDGGGAVVKAAKPRRRYFAGEGALSKRVEIGWNCECLGRCRAAYADRAATLVGGARQGVDHIIGNRGVIRRQRLSVTAQSAECAGRCRATCRPAWRDMIALSFQYGLWAIALMLRAMND